MSRTVRIIVGLVVLVVLVAAAAFAYIYISGGSGEASAPISAPTLAPAAATDAVGSTGDTTVFNINSTQSQVSFTLTEELNRQPTTVVGTTDQVAGQIAVDFGSPSASQIGEIRINARTLATDQDMRNRTIRGQILQSSQDQFEFITFQPTALSGMPELDHHRRTRHLPDHRRLDHPRRHQIGHLRRDRDPRLRDADHRHSDHHRPAGGLRPEHPQRATGRQRLRRRPTRNRLRGDRCSRNHPHNLGAHLRVRPCRGQTTQVYPYNAAYQPAPLLPACVGEGVRG